MQNPPELEFEEMQHGVEEYHVFLCIGTTEV
jgi:hypothetical protein